MSQAGSQIVAYTVRMLLLPVVRFCLRRAVKFQEFSAIARSVFIEAASSELSGGAQNEAQSAGPTEVSTSRLSVVTGLTRREVDRLARNAPEPVKGQNLIIKVIGQWNGDKRFLDTEGTPKALSCEGLESQFAKLVAQVSKDLNHHTVLFELERLGFVERSAEAVRLAVPAYVTRENAKEGTEMLSSDVGDLLSAVEENVLGDGKLPHLHARTEYDNIAFDKLPEIRKWLLEFGRRAHAEVRRYLARFDTDINPKLRGKRGGARVKLGTFSYVVEGRGGKR